MVDKKTTYVNVWLWNAQKKHDHTFSIPYSTIDIFQVCRVCGKFSFLMTRHMRKFSFFVLKSAFILLAHTGPYPECNNSVVTIGAPPANTRRTACSHALTKTSVLRWTFHPALLIVIVDGLSWLKTITLSNHCVCQLCDSVYCFSCAFGTIPTHFKENILTSKNYHYFLKTETFG